jgi:predicted CopG family antitoxin
MEQERQIPKTKTINLRTDLWQKLHTIYAQNPQLKSMQDVIERLIEKNKSYRQKIAELEGKKPEQKVIQVEQ